MPVVNVPSEITPEDLEKLGIDESVPEKTQVEATAPMELMKVDPKTRGMAIKSFKGVHRNRVVDSLIEGALASGITDVKDIREWLGDETISVLAITNSIERVITEWVREMNGAQFSNQTRATLIKSVWKDIRSVEEKAQEAKDNTEWIKLKQLKLSLLQQIASLAYIEQLRDVPTASQNIMVIGGAADHNDLPKDSE